MFRMWEPLRQLLPLRKFRLKRILWKIRPSTSLLLPQRAEEQNISSIEVNHISKILKIMNCLEKSRFTWKYFCVYFNNYFTSVQLMIHLLTDDIYSCGTVQMNRRGFPDDLKGRLRLQRGQSVTRQKGNLTPFCVDKMPVAFLMMSDPHAQVPVTRQHGRQELRPTQLHSANEYTSTWMGLIDMINSDWNIPYPGWYDTTPKEIRAFMGC